MGRNASVVAVSSLRYNFCRNCSVSVLSSLLDGLWEWCLSVFFFFRYAGLDEGTHIGAKVNYHYEEAHIVSSYTHHTHTNTPTTTSITHLAPNVSLLNLHNHHSHVNRFLLGAWCWLGRTVRHTESVWKCYKCGQHTPRIMDLMRVWLCKCWWVWVSV